jgi:hypothetical protein
MFILARGGEAYSRLRFNVGPETSQRVNVEVDYSTAFDASDEDAWAHEFETNVEKFVPPASKQPRRTVLSRFGDPDFDFDPFASDEWLDRFDADPLFLDWEKSECQTPMAATPA